MLYATFVGKDMFGLSMVELKLEHGPSCVHDISECLALALAWAKDKNTILLPLKRLKADNWYST